MKGRFKVAGTLAGLLLLASPAAQAATHKDVTVTGAGATFPLNMIEQWKSDFNKSTGVSIAYTGVGSGAGRAQLIAGTVDFAGSDVPAAAAEVQQLNDKYGSFVSIPEIAGAISVQYNLPGITGLKLSGATLAKIFSGKVTSWNDPAIAADNGSAGPNLPIQVFVRPLSTAVLLFVGLERAAGSLVVLPGGGEPEDGIFEREAILRLDASFLTAFQLVLDECLPIQFAVAV